MLVCFRYTDDMTKAEKIWTAEVEFMPRIGETVSITDNTQYVDFQVIDVKTILSKSINNSKFHVDYVVVLGKKEIRQYVYAVRPSINPNTANHRKVAISN